MNCLTCHARQLGFFFLLNANTPLQFSKKVTFVFCICTEGDPNVDKTEAGRTGGKVLK